MKTTNKIKNIKVKPAYTVDLTKCEDAFDVLLAFAYTKQEAGYPLTTDELNAIIEDNSTTIFIREFVCDCECEPKKPWYKRFWNWLTRKKN